MSESDEHGTYRAYQRHIRGGTVPCRACCRANADYNRTRRRRSKCAPGLGWPLEPGRVARMLGAEGTTVGESRCPG